MKNRLLHSAIIIFILGYIAFLVFNNSIIPNPVLIIKEFFRSLGDKLLLHIGVSLYRIVIALCMSMIIGIPMGLFIGHNKSIDKFIMPFTYLFYPIPKITFLPVLMIFFGIGNTSKIILIFLIIFIQIILSVRDGVKEIPEELYISVKSLSLSKKNIYKHLLFPAILPKVFTSIRITLGISISALFFSENFATEYGIGYFIMNSWSMVNYTAMYAGILAMSIMGICIFKVIDFAEKRICPWLFLNAKL